MRNFVDLHTHSAASDGTLPPAEVVWLAERKRLAAVALTDHDTADGLAEAARAARPLAVRFIPGIEISAQFTGGALHLVGLGIDPADRGLRAVLGQLMAARRQRNPRMIEKLRRLGVDITMAEVRALAGGAVVGRLHMAQVLCRKGRARTVQEAFGRYLGCGAPAFVDKERLTPRQALEGIHAAGGLGVLAHPPQLNYGNLAQLERIVRSLVRHGLDGLEVYHPDHTPDQTRWYLDLARRLGLLVAGGSDFHGAGKPEVRLGRPKVPLAAVEQLLAKLGL
ncbi:MAG: hypothetical protein AMJ81_11630 [Phycisphaerae bacterium SM23_33]|nr:MAG: hypothetical protein AMJ81_11630 [Phycisphaerae bacterium SM23_33]